MSSIHPLAPVLALLGALLAPVAPVHLTIAGATTAPLVSSDATAAGAAVGDLLPGALNVGPVEQALLVQTNADRASAGLAPLDFDPEALSVARQRASAQLGIPELSHYDGGRQPVFVGLLLSRGLGFSVAGENLARLSSDEVPDLPNSVEGALMSSSEHRANILDPAFTRLAIGEATDASGRVAFAEIFRALDQP